MKIKIYSVMDSSTGVYALPYYSERDESAIRMFAMLVNDSRNVLINQHPEDFVLYRIGEFDDDLGVVTGDVPVIISKAVDVVKRVPQYKSLVDSKFGVVPVPENGVEEVKQ